MTESYHINEKDEKLKKKFNILKSVESKFNSLKNIDQRNFNIIRRQIYEMIQSFDIKNDEEKINILIQKINSFINYCENSEQKGINKNQNLIDLNFLSIMSNNDNKDTNKIRPNERKFDNLMWYSLMVDQLKLIQEDNNNIIKYLMKINELNDIKENYFFTYFILNNYINPKNTNLSLKNKHIIFSSLNAFFIYKFFINERYGDYSPFKIDNYINFFKLRQIENEPNFILNVYKYLNSFDGKFMLYIPKFKPSDLLFLFINLKSEDNGGNYV